MGWPGGQKQLCCQLTSIPHALLLPCPKQNSSSRGINQHGAWRSDGKASASDWMCWKWASNQQEGAWSKSRLRQERIENCLTCPWTNKEKMNSRSLVPFTLPSVSCLAAPRHAESKPSSGNQQRPPLPQKSRACGWGLACGQKATGRQPSKNECTFSRGHH